MSCPLLFLMKKAAGAHYVFLQLWLFLHAKINDQPRHMVMNEKTRNEDNDSYICLYVYCIYAAIINYMSMATTQNTSMKNNR